MYGAVRKSFPRLAVESAQARQVVEAEEDLWKM